MANLCKFLIWSITVIYSESEAKTTNRKIIIDCDAGVDDLYAIQFVLNEPDVEILGITTVDGNVEPRQVARNVLRLLLANEIRDQIPVYVGQKGPILKTTSIEKAFWFGQDGLHDVPDVDPPSSDVTDDMIQDEPAVMALIRLINANVGEVDLIAIGPLTNIAVALNLDPSIAQKLKSFTVMGGNIYSLGNADNYLAEYNFYLDPDAAFVALERLVPNTITNIVSLEFPTKYPFAPEMVHGIATNTTLGNFFNEISATEIKRYEDSLALDHQHEFEGNGFIFCDLYAPIILLYPETITSSENFDVTVERTGTFTRGMMVVDRTKWLLGRNSTAWIPIQSDMAQIMTIPSLKFD